MPVRPRRLAHRGVVPAAGFFLADGVVDEITILRRLIALDAETAKVTGGWLVLFRRAVATRCDRAPGAPLVTIAPGLLSTAPLERDEIEALLPRGRESIVLVRAGEAYVVEERTPIDLAEWIDVAGYEVVEVETLGAPSPPPRAVLVPPRTPHEVLGVAAPDPAREQVLAELAARARGAAAGEAGGGASAEGIAATVRGFFAALSSLFAASGAEGSAAPKGRSSRSGFGAFLVALASLVLPTNNRLRQASDRGEPASQDRGPSPDLEEPSPSFFDRARAAMRRALAELLFKTRLGAVLGQKHAAYIARMMALFEQGNLDEALRYALPLRNEEVDEKTEPSELSILPPKPRSELEIRLGARARRSALGLGDDLFGELEQRYRRAFDKLSALGRHRDAAFVLVELLGRAEEAVSYLERQRLFRLAAEIAEGKRLPPGLVVRQWMLAGDHGRALALARRHHAFGDALVRLESANVEAGRAFRLLWADHLAETGAYAAAVDVVWPIEDARALGRAWIDRALVVGGTTGARMLARKIVLSPEEGDTLRELVLDLLDDESLDGPTERVAFGTELNASAPTALGRMFARATARALLRDDPTSPLAVKVARASGDEVLRADLDAAPAGMHRAAPVTEPIARSAGDRGLMPVLDAVLLPRGAILVALGEAGARVVASDGRTRMRFLAPAHRFVMSDQGDRVIVLAPRGRGLYRLARIDLVNHRISPWTDARIDAFAPTFDGSTWFVAVAGTIHAIDTLEPGWTQIWSGNVDGHVSMIARSDASVLAVRERLEPSRSGTPEPAWELWRFELPGLVLRSRRPSAERVVGVVADPSPAGAVVTQGPFERGTMRVALTDGNFATPLTFDVVDADSVPIAVSPEAMAIRTRASWATSLVHVRRAGLPQRIDLLETRDAGARFDQDRLLVFDTSGRVLVVKDGRVLAEWRIG